MKTKEQYSDKGWAVASGATATVGSLITGLLLSDAFEGMNKSVKRTGAKGFRKYLLKSKYLLPLALAAGTLGAAEGYSKKKIQRATIDYLAQNEGNSMVSKHASDMTLERKKQIQEAYSICKEAGLIKNVLGIGKKTITKPKKLPSVHAIRVDNPHHRRMYSKQMSKGKVIGGSGP